MDDMERELKVTEDIGAGIAEMPEGKIAPVSLYLMVHANLLGIPSANWTAQWWKAEPMIAALGSHIVSQTETRRQVDMFATRTERTAATARKVAEILERDFKLALNIGELWDGGFVPQGRHLGRSERAEILASAKEPNTATVLIGHHETIRLFSPDHYHLGNYAEVVYIHDRSTSFVAQGYDY